MDIVKKSGKLPNLQKMQSSPDPNVRQMATELLNIIGMILS